MWCLISQPNSVVFEVRGIDPKSIGQKCLEKVCEYLGISNESDYFGLKFENNKGEELWLNLRNPIDRQVPCHGSTNPLRLALRVKFWVPPHLLLQESTRHQFYLHAKDELLAGRLLAKDWDGVASLAALIAQADADPMMGGPPAAAAALSPAAGGCAGSRPPDLPRRIAARRRRCAGMRAAAAEYWLLKQAAELEAFGEERFGGRQCGGVTIGVGPHGINVYRKDQAKQSISFASILSASSHKRIFKLEYLSPEAKEALLEIKLDSSHVASSLYRALTEKHAFYSCETVRSAVTTQFIRDLKGTIVSIFNEDSTLGRKYVFDIQRTCREVYDNARRVLYQENVAQVPKIEASCCHDGVSYKDSEEKLNRLVDALTCKICMDNQIDVVFLPCAHVVACTSCAARVDRCPLCRSEFEHAQKLYLPSEFCKELAT